MLGMRRQKTHSQRRADMIEIDAPTVTFARRVGDDGGPVYGFEIDIRDADGYTTRIYLGEEDAKRFKDKFDHMLKLQIEDKNALERMMK